MVKSPLSDTFWSGTKNLNKQFSFILAIFLTKKSSLHLDSIDKWLLMLNTPSNISAIYSLYIINNNEDLLKSSVSDGRPYSDCTVSYYIFRHFCPGDFSEMTGRIYLKFSG